MDPEKFEAAIGKLDGCAKALKDGADKSAHFEKDAAARESSRQAMKNFALTLRDILMDFMKERKEQVRPGQLYRDAAAKNLVPSGLAVDALIMKWGGSVTPSEARDVRDDLARFGAVAEKLLPVLKAYRKE